MTKQEKNQTKENSNLHQLKKLLSLHLRKMLWKNLLVFLKR